MKHENGMKLNVPAFALAGGITGLVMGFFMMGATGMMYGGMMGYGAAGGLWAGVLMGIFAGAFAWLYNMLSEKVGS